jgi:hypothetical protein
MVEATEMFAETPQTKEEEAKNTHGMRSILTDHLNVSHWVKATLAILVISSLHSLVYP